MRADVRVRLAALVVLATVAVALAVSFGVPSITQVRQHCAGTGPLAALGFAAVYALFSLLPLPAEVFTIAAGVVFGLGRGLPIVVLGASLGALGGFSLGRVLGRDAVAHLAGPGPGRWTTS